jgi:hypothetical protein
MNLDKLIEAFLKEAAALTKGSQRVFADKKLVAALAAAVRDDAAINPEAFPPGSKNNFKKATDDAVAQWFLENIDQIEREGYESTVYSRDGANSDWIVRRYIAGSHTWEDLTGVMNMNLRDWYLLKNRNMLDPNHKDLAKFKSVRDVGFYMTTHYKDELEKVRDAAKNAARNKMAKNFKLVDNDDYRIYTAINRAAGCALGLGTQWCTANSNYGGHFHSYSGRAMLFQLFPYVTKKNAETGEEELGLSETAKYQFDAGGPTFMDITDHPVPAAKVRETFPYIYADLSTALKKNKGKMEKAFEEWAADPTLQHEDFKIKNYEIDEEIKKLHKFVDRGYFTDEARPVETSAEEPAGEQPQIGAEPAQEQPPQEPQMETLKDLARAMLEDKTLGHVVQKYVPINKDGQESPMTNGGDNLDETNVDECGLQGAKQSLLAALAARSGKGQQAMGEDDMMQDPAMAGDVGAQAATGGGMGGGGSAGGGGGQYPPGTAPTMPESIQTKEVAMENVDKDVAAMMASLKKYDKLNESVLGMVTLSMAKPKVVSEEKDFFHNPNVPANKQLKAPPKEVNIEEEELEEDTVDDFKAKGGKVKELPYKADKEEKGKSMGSKHYGKGGQGSKGAVSGLKARVNTAEAVTETADPEVLEWMSRFSKLGNMKGYGK